MPTNWAPDLQEILSNASDYALIEGSEYLPFNVKTQSWLLVNLEIAQLNLFIAELLELGARKVKSKEEVIDPNFVHYISVWNEEKQDWDKVDRSKLQEFLKSDEYQAK